MNKSTRMRLKDSSDDCSPRTSSTLASFPEESVLRKIKPISPTLPPRYTFNDSIRTKRSTQCCPIVLRLSENPMLKRRGYQPKSKTSISRANTSDHFNSR